MTFDHDDPQKTIQNYHDGFLKNDPEMVLSSLGQHFSMTNGNFSDDPTDWQAHLFLAGDDLEAWPKLFVQEAGPYKNRTHFLHCDIREEAAIVVTKETGHNRFRSWENELTTWMLGRIAGDWKITGLYIRDIKNPGT